MSSDDFMNWYSLSALNHAMVKFFSEISCKFVIWVSENFYDYFEEILKFAEFPISLESIRDKKIWNTSMRKKF